MERVLVIGYGNPGRLDDGLGPAVADAVAAWRLPGVHVDADYQLCVEDAAVIAEHDVVLFVDASVTGPEPYAFERLTPAADLAPGFSSHSLEPAALMALARELFGARAEGWVLAVRGYAFDEFGERLSPRALANMHAALAFLGPVLAERRLSDAVSAPAGSDAPPTTR